MSNRVRLGWCGGLVGGLFEGKGGVLALLCLPVVLAGCITISKEDYRRGLIWTPVPASERIDAVVRVETECGLSREYETTWKNFGNNDVTIANYSQATCDAIMEDMIGAQLFRRVTPAVEGNSDLLVKVFATEGVSEIQIDLAVFNPKNRELLARYAGARPLPSLTHSERKDLIPRLLADLREQLLEDCREGNQIAKIVAVKTKTVAVKTTPPEPAGGVSDVDNNLPVKSAQKPNAYAVVVGIEQYRQKLPPADFATADARTVTAYLTQVLGYPEENVVTLTNDRAALGDFVKYFEKWLPNNVESGGTVFVYYSGHGAPNPKTGDAYLVPYDGDPAFIDETGYSLKRMYAALGKLPAKSIVVALDSCFSGAGGRSVIAKGTRSITLNLKEQAPLAGNMTVLAASSGEQTSSTYDEKGHGLFTYFFLKGIKHEDVVSPDGSLRLDDLFAYLKPQVERVARKQFNNEQTPQLIEASAGH